MPPDRPEHDVLEAVLAHVVARAEHERRVDLGVVVEQLGDVAVRRRPPRRAAAGA